MVVVLEYFQRQGQFAIHVVVDLLHHHQRDFLVRDVADERVFEHMREGPVANVVHEDGSLYGLGLRVEDEDAFLCQARHGLAHQVEGTQRVQEARVLRPGIDHTGHAHLFDARKALHQRVFHDVEEQSGWDSDKPEHGVVDDFHVVHGCEGTKKYRECSKLA